MRGDLTIRTVRTASGATAVQVVQNKGKQRPFLKHIGSAHTEHDLELLMAKAREYAAAHCRQPSLFAKTPPDPFSSSLTNVLAQTKLIGVTHQFARRVLLACARKCGLGDLHEFDLDLALMRIIEPASTLKTLKLLERYFSVRYVDRTVYRLLSKLIEHQATIETAAIQTARDDMQETFNLVLYDVTTLYFESFKEYDFQKPGFSKDNKPMQPCSRKPTYRNWRTEGYCYIVGARLANTAASFINQIDRTLPRADKAIRRFDYGHSVKNAAMISEFSDARYKNKREFDKQVKRAHDLLEKNEPGRRAKFVKKSKETDKAFIFDTALQAKTEKLLGVKGFVTNIPEETMSSTNVILYYRDLWHVEQACRISKSDLQARPIFHRTQDAIRAHMLICFMGLMMGKYLEINTGLSLRKIREELWKVHEAQILDQKTGEVYVMLMEISEITNRLLEKIGFPVLSH